MPTAKRIPPTAAHPLDIEAVLLVAVADNERLKDQQAALVDEIIRLRKVTARLLFALQRGQTAAWVGRNKKARVTK